MKTTGWSRGEEKPEYKGVYERYGQFRNYSYFNGLWWSCGSPWLATALDYNYRDTEERQTLLWRGLTEPHCKKCGTMMVEGIALTETWVAAYDDFVGAEIVTMSPGGPGWQIDCYKCPACGWSMTR